MSDASASDADTSTPDGPVAARCGDGAIDTGEECDDGNLDDGDECTSDCKLPWDCQPGDTQPYYDGPAGTEDVGLCRAGQLLCDSEGKFSIPTPPAVIPQPENCETADDESCDGYADCGVIQWTYSTSSLGDDVGYDVAVDAHGDLVLTGKFDGSVDFGGGPLSSVGKEDVFVVKLGPGGEHLWSLRLGGASDDVGNRIAIDSHGNALVIGEFGDTVDFGGGPLDSAGGSDVFVVKLGPGGEHLWSRRFGSTSDEAGWGIAVDHDDNVLLTGEFDGMVNFGGGDLDSAGSKDVFAVKLNPAGEHLWSHRFGSPDSDRGKSVAVDSAGNALFVGYFRGITNLGGEPLESAGDYDLFVVKLNPDGQHLWSKRFGGAAYERSWDIALDSEDNPIVAGYFEGTTDLGSEPLVSAGSSDVFVLKLDPDGQHLWSKRFGGTSTERGRVIAVDHRDNVLLTGYFEETATIDDPPLESAGSADALMVKLDPDGHPLWSRSLGGTNYDTGWGIAVNSDNAPLFVGYLQSEVDFGTNMFLVKLSP